MAAMQKFNVSVCVLMFCFPHLCAAQRIDNTASYRNVIGDKYIRLHYDNDFYGKTDYYYTQGYQLELVNPFLRKSPVSRALVRLKASRTKYGLSFEHYGFTPTSIRSDTILSGDRPFTGVILLKSFSISVDAEKRRRLASVLSIGMIGPAAFAGRMQATIHRWTNNAVPHGWQYQIRNDIVVNYELSHEREIFNIENIVSLNTNAKVSLGTLLDKAHAGFTLTAGRFDSPFRKTEKKHSKNFQLYLFTQPLVGTIGYDASLQGGIFNRNSPYVIKSESIQRFTFQNTFGIAAHIWKAHFEYSQTFITKEFSTGLRHRWGGIKIGYSF
jgi:lipid A 3-O-deacylase